MQQLFSVDNPAAPDVNPKMAYGNFKITDVIDFQTILNQVPVNIRFNPGRYDLQVLIARQLQILARNV